MKAEVDRDRLIDALIERGVTYLDGGRGLPGGIGDTGLIAALAQSDDRSSTCPAGCHAGAAKQGWMLSS